MLLLKQNASASTACVCLSIYAGLLFHEVKQFSASCVYVAPEFPHADGASSLKLAAMIAGGLVVMVGVALVINNSESDNAAEAASVVESEGGKKGKKSKKKKGNKGNDTPKSQIKGMEVTNPMWSG